jgi:PIN domain nuclease of toxin-antitoxin system
MAAREAILDSENDLFFSAASYWEICIKLRLKKLQLSPDWPQVFDEEMKANRIVWLTVAREHCRRLLDLPHIHADPFDRLLIAQAQVENMALVTADSSIRSYPISVIW